MSRCTFCDLPEVKNCSALVADFEPLDPVTEGHRLFVPIEHMDDAADDPIITARTFMVAAAYAAEQPEAFNLITSAGTDATQSVFHLHVHYIPRRENDGLTLPWTGQIKREK